jgi:uracil-DNA glycosylase
MATILDNLIENIKHQIAQGKTHANIDQDVLAELYTEYDTPVISIPKAIPQEQKIEPEPKIEVAPLQEQSTIPVQKPIAPQPIIEEAVSAPPEPVPIPATQFPIPTPTTPNIPTKDVSNLSLDELRQQGNSCTSCKLDIGENRSENTGLSAKPRLMIITEPAGTRPEFLVDPYAGEAGKLLIKMITAMNIDMADVYLCMAHRCFGPGARETISQTKPYLEQQIKLLDPEVIVIFGGAAVNILLNEQSLVKCRGKWLEIGNIPTIATYPPGYLLKKASAKREAWADLQQVMARLNL